MKIKSILLYRSSIWLVCFLFSLTTVVGPGSVSLAQGVSAPGSGYGFINTLPIPGNIVSLSSQSIPVNLLGIRVHPDNPFLFDFVIHGGDQKVRGDELKVESQKLIKYFLTSLTIPEEDLWVNLSPYEKNRVIPDAFGRTLMGRDLLAEDYLLKQLTSSLLHPDHELGKKFWHELREQLSEKYGDIDIPMDTFNKVWILPAEATIYEEETHAYIMSSSLKVLMEEDLLALDNELLSEEMDFGKGNTDLDEGVNQISSKIMYEVIIPAIEKEVNEGENFVRVRQVYRALILANWYKQRLRDSLFAKLYMDKNKVRGVENFDKDIKEKIFQQYIKSYQVGVFDFITEEYDPVTQAMIPRKYFSGGLHFSAKNISRATRSIRSPEALAENISKDAATLGNDNIHVVRAKAQPQGVKKSSKGRLGLVFASMLAAGATLGEPGLLPAQADPHTSPPVVEEKTKQPYRIIFTDEEGVQYFFDVIHNSSREVGTTINLENKNRRGGFYHVHHLDEFGVPGKAVLQVNTVKNREYIYLLDEFKEEMIYLASYDQYGEFASVFDASENWQDYQRLFNKLGQLVWGDTSEEEPLTAEDIQNVTFTLRDKFPEMGVADNIFISKDGDIPVEMRGNLNMPHRSPILIGFDNPLANIDDHLDWPITNVQEFTFEQSMPGIGNYVIADLPDQRGMRLWALNDQEGNIISSGVADAQDTDQSIKMMVEALAQVASGEIHNERYPFSGISFSSVISQTLAYTAGKSYLNLLEQDPTRVTEAYIFWSVVLKELPYDLHGRLMNQLDTLSANLKSEGYKNLSMHLFKDYSHHHSAGLKRLAQKEWNNGRPQLSASYLNEALELTQRLAGMEFDSNTDFVFIFDIVKGYHFSLLGGGRMPIPGQDYRIPLQMLESWLNRFDVSNVGYITADTFSSLADQINVDRLMDALLNGGLGVRPFLNENNFPYNFYADSDYIKENYLSEEDADYAEEVSDIIKEKIAEFESLQGLVGSMAGVVPALPVDQRAGLSQRLVSVLEKIIGDVEEFRIIDSMIKRLDLYYIEQLGDVYYDKLMELLLNNIFYDEYLADLFLKGYVKESFKERVVEYISRHIAPEMKGYDDFPGLFQLNRIISMVNVIGQRDMLNSLIKKHHIRQFEGDEVFKSETEEEFTVRQERILQIWMNHGVVIDDISSVSAKDPYYLEMIDQYFTMLGSRMLPYLHKMTIKPAPTGTISFGGWVLGRAINGRILLHPSDASLDGLIEARLQFIKAVMHEVGHVFSFEHNSAERRSWEQLYDRADVERYDGKKLLDYFLTFHDNVNEAKYAKTNYMEDQASAHVSIGAHTASLRSALKTAQEKGLYDRLHRYLLWLSFHAEQGSLDLHDLSLEDIFIDGNPEKIINFLPAGTLNVLQWHASGLMQQFEINGEIYEITFDEFGFIRGVTIEQDAKVAPASISVPDNTKQSAATAEYFNSRSVEVTEASDWSAWEANGNQTTVVQVQSDGSSNESEQITPGGILFNPSLINMTTISDPERRTIQMGVTSEDISQFQYEGFAPSIIHIAPFDFFKSTVF